VGEEEAVESFTWIAQYQDWNGKSSVVLRNTHRLRSDEGREIR